MPWWTPASLRTLSETMLDLDDPAHRRLRVLINKAFSRAERLVGDFSLLGSAVEELLRFTAPVETATERYAAQDIDMHPTRIRRGDVIFPVIASANRDAQKFAEPDRAGRNPQAQSASCVWRWRSLLRRLAPGEDGGRDRIRLLTETPA